MKHKPGLPYGAGCSRMRGKMNRNFSQPGGYPIASTVAEVKGRGDGRIGSGDPKATGNISQESIIRQIKHG